MFSGILFIICIIAIIVSIYSAIKIFNNKNIPKKKRTRDAYLELAFAVAIIFSFSNNPILIAISVVLMIIAFSSAIRAYFVARKRAKRIIRQSRKINRIIQNNPDVKDEVAKLINQAKADDSSHIDLNRLGRKIEKKVKEMENHEKNE